MSEKICAIVVTYNRKDLLKTNIEKLLEQNVLFDIIVVDNCSNDGTDKFIIDKYNENFRIKYFKLETNQGGAGGFYFGMKKAMELQYDLLILMDDDGYPIDKFTIKKLLDVYYSENNPYTIVNSLVLKDETTNELTFSLCRQNKLDDLKKYIKDNKIEDNISPFNGTLISKEIVNKIGYPKKEFFISGDEVEYSIRAKKNGIKLITAIESRYYHPNQQLMMKNIFGKKFIIRQQPLWRIYYHYRNYNYIYRTYYPKYYCYKLYLSLIVLQLLSPSNHFKKIKIAINGIKDEKKGKFDNTMHLKKEMQEKC